MHSLVQRAEVLATQIHAGQTRDHGLPYITHPAMVVESLQSWGVTDPIWLATGWLHDAWEDGWDPTAIEQSIQALHEDIWRLVSNLSKPWQVDARMPRDPDSYFATIRQDQALTWIKIADRLSNLHDLSQAPAEKQIRYRQKTQRDFLDPEWPWMTSWQRTLLQTAIEPMMDERSL